MRTEFYTTVILSVLLLAAAAVAAQVRVDVRLVNVVATVTDGRGRSVADLKMEDFIIEEDGVPQTVAHFTQDQDVPVSMGILLDTSGSMDRRIRTAIEAVERFTRRVQASDDIFLISFSGQPTLRQDFTGDRERLSQALRHVNATGGTALYDALDEGLRKIRAGRHSKQAILLITDGQDTASTARFEDILQFVRQEDVLIYPVGISGLSYAKDFDPFSVPGVSALSALRPARTAQTRRDEVDFNVLRALAETSGGRAFVLAETLVNRGREIEKVLDKIADELRTQYTLGFYPPRPDDGRFHSLRIRTRTGNAVRARRGYLATP